MPESHRGGWAVLDVPVLMVEPVILGNVKPHQPQQAVLVQAGEQVRNLCRRPSHWTHGGLGKQYRLAGKDPYLGDGLAEDISEGFVRAIIIAIDSDPGYVLCAGPPRGNRPGTMLICLESPEPD